MKCPTPVFLLGLVTGCAADVVELGPGMGEGEAPTSMSFVERTAEAGFRVPLLNPSPRPPLESISMIGGVAAGDVDGDSDIDLFLVSEGSEVNLLYLNRGDGTFREVSAGGARDIPQYESGPLFVDYDGDGDLDLMIGGIRLESQRQHNSVMVFRNSGNGAFVDVTPATGLVLPPEVDTYSISAGDIDGDRLLDLFLTHWHTFLGRDALGNPITTHGDHFLWKNSGAGRFVDVTRAYGLDGLQFTFTANFSDIDRDGDLDILLASDFGNSKVLRNDGGTFAEEPGSLLSDENGMGASVGDYDNDGDLDWFVTSIWDSDGISEGNWGITGNRLYANDGQGGFTDVSARTGTRVGYWGWGSCFADFDNDGNLDLFHVNGWNGDGPEDSEFLSDPSRLFMSNGDGTFVERASELGLSDTNQGRGVVCFDADRDGDIDIFVANNRASPSFFVNEGTGLNSYLGIVLRGDSPNTQGIGARITVTTGGGEQQIREIRAGNNFLSQNPAEAHFGLGREQTVDVSVRWPGESLTVLDNVAVNQVLVIHQSVTSCLPTIDERGCLD